MSKDDANISPDPDFLKDLHDVSPDPEGDERAMRDHDRRYDNKATIRRLARDLGVTPLWIGAENGWCIDDAHGNRLARGTHSMEAIAWLATRLCDEVDQK